MEKSLYLFLKKKEWNEKMEFWKIHQNFMLFMRKILSQVLLPAADSIKIWLILFDNKEKKEGDKIKVKKLISLATLTKLLHLFIAFIEGDMNLFFVNTFSI